MMQWFSEIFASLWNLIQLHWLEIFVWTIQIVFAIFLVQVLHAVFSRFLFVSKLKILAKKKSMKFEVHRSPLCSLLFRAVLLDITMKTPDETFYIFFCPGNVRKRNVYVFDDTKIYYAKTRGLSFWDNRSWKGNPPLVTAVEMNKKEIELSLQPIDQGHNILMLEPNPIGLFVRHGNGYARSGSGDVIGELTVYEGKDFIHYMERNFKGETQI